MIIETKFPNSSGNWQVEIYKYNLINRISLEYFGQNRLIEHAKWNLICISDYLHYRN